VGYSISVPPGAECLPKESSSEAPYQAVRGVMVVAAPIFGGPK